MIDWELLLSIADEHGWRPSEFWRATLAELTITIANDMARRSAKQSKATNEAALDTFFDRLI